MISFGLQITCEAAALAVVSWWLFGSTIPAVRARTRRKAALDAARTFILSYEDLPAYAPGGELAGRMDALRAALGGRDSKSCEELLGELDPPKPFAAGREWLDILVVSISVAMAFRAYFYEPFQIPTGSMQPTLYGNHSEPLSPREAGVFDTTPLKWVKWFFCGKMYECYTAPFEGVLQYRPTNDGYYDMRVVAPGRVSGPMKIPTDVLHADETGDGPYRGVPKLPNGLMFDSPVRAGQVLWSGLVARGDFLFVNRWLWNFRHPRRGDVMIFSTTGIEGLAQGTHYIKRMTGVPGETLSVKDGSLWVDGAKPMEPRRIAQIQKREKGEEHMYPYAGYRPSGNSGYNVPGRTIAADGDEVKLGAGEFYACGDNSPSSYDSRYWGPVPAKNLVGVAGGVFWPTMNPRWGVVE